MTNPIPMRLVCERCGELHIDEGEFATKPHHTHACQFCGAVWRPALVNTVGVRFLPGFKDETADPEHKVRLEWLTGRTEFWTGRVIPDPRTYTFDLRRYR